MSLLKSKIIIRIIFIYSNYKTIEQYIYLIHVITNHFSFLTMNRISGVINFYRSGEII